MRAARCLCLAAWLVACARAEDEIVGYEIDEDRLPELSDLLSELGIARVHDTFVDAGFDRTRMLLKMKDMDLKMLVREETLTEAEADALRGRLDVLRDVKKPVKRDVRDPLMERRAAPYGRLYIGARPPRPSSAPRGSASMPAAQLPLVFARPRARARRCSRRRRRRGGGGGAPPRRDRRRRARRLRVPRQGGQRLGGGRGGARDRQHGQRAHAARGRLRAGARTRRRSRAPTSRWRRPRGRDGQARRARAARARRRRPARAGAPAPRARLVPLGARPAPPSARRCSRPTKPPPRQRRLGRARARRVAARRGLGRRRRAAGRASPRRGPGAPRGRARLAAEPADACAPLAARPPASPTPAAAAGSRSSRRRLRSAPRPRPRGPRAPTRSSSSRTTRRTPAAHSATDDDVTRLALAIPGVAVLAARARGCAPRSTTRSRGAPAPRVTLAPAPLGLAALWLGSRSRWPRPRRRRAATPAAGGSRTSSRRRPKKNKQPKVSCRRTRPASGCCGWERLDVALGRDAAEPRRLESDRGRARLAPAWAEATQSASRDGEKRGAAAGVRPKAVAGRGARSHATAVQRSTGSVAESSHAQLCIALVLTDSAALDTCRYCGGATGRRRP